MKKVMVIVGAGVALHAFAAEPSMQQGEQPRQEQQPAQAQPSTTDANPAGQGAAGAAAVRQTTAPTDRLELDTTVVTGNRELPKVLYIVPWKKADIGELPAQPFNTLLDEVLTPVDRDVFRREVTYYETVSDTSNAANAPAARPEK